jgi:hypothetical protein
MFDPASRKRVKKGIRTTFRRRLWLQNVFIATYNYG